MNQNLPRSAFIERAFWVAAALAVGAAVLPLVVTIGQPNRLAGAFWPLAAAAIGMGALALIYRQGKTVAALVYFLTGLAVAYGMMLMLAVPLRLAILGSCPRPPASCVGDLELQLSAGESTALTIAVAFGAMSLLAGFLGLSVLYRHREPALPPPVWPDKAPDKPPAKSATGETPASSEAPPPASAPPAEEPASGPVGEPPSETPTEPEDEPPPGPDEVPAESPYK